MNSLVKRVVVSFVAVAIAIFATMQFSTEVAFAQFGRGGCVPVCLDDLPGGSSPGGNGTYEDSSSCLAVFTDQDYEFRIINDTGHTMPYSINGEQFTLYAGESWDHSFPSAYGSNSCDTQSYPLPSIEFDSSYESGFQSTSYAVGDYTEYKFQRDDYGIDLHYVSTSSGASNVSTEYYGADTYTSGQMYYGDEVYDSVSSSSGDSWTFSGSQGEWVRITLTSYDMDTYLELRDPWGYIIAEDDDGAGGTNSQIYIDSLPATGTYTIIARGYYGESGSYDLLLE